MKTYEYVAQGLSPPPPFSRGKILAAPLRRRHISVSKGREYRTQRSVTCITFSFMHAPPKLDWCITSFSEII